MAIKMLQNSSLLTKTTVLKANLKAMLKTKTWRQKKEAKNK